MRPLPGNSGEKFLGKGLHRERRSGAKGAEAGSALAGKESTLLIPDDPEAREAHRRREKAAALKLRQSPWWQKKLAEGRCYYCQNTFSPSALTMDHALPISKGGRSTRSNIVAACKDCNTSKKNDLAIDRPDLTGNS